MNYWKQRLTLALTVGTMTACGGAAIPHTQLSDAKSSQSAAEAVGARDEPQAALHLKMAEDAIVQAEKLIAEEENEEAARVLVRARSDAELALAITNEAKTKAAAEVALAKLEALRTDIAAQGEKS